MKCLICSFGADPEEVTKTIQRPKHSPTQAERTGVIQPGEGKAPNAQRSLLVPSGGLSKKEGE